jgi:hypothetical protein
VAAKSVMARVLPRPSYPSRPAAARLWPARTCEPTPRALCNRGNARGRGHAGRRAQGTSSGRGAGRAHPPVAADIAKLGHTTLVESGAGEAAGFADDAYRAAGVEVVPDAATLACLRRCGQGPPARARRGGAPPLRPDADLLLLPSTAPELLERRAPPARP